MIKEETKQTAEEAARGYSNDCRNRQRHCERYCIVDFISGAQWQSKQSPWISVIFWNNERTLVPEAKKLAYIADYEIDDNGEVVPSLRQLDYNGGMSAIPLFVNLKKAIIELA